MGKSSKKSNVEVAPAAVAVPPVKSPKKGGKRDSDQVIATSPNAKKQKVNVAIPKKNGKKSKKAPIPEKKEPETIDSEDVSSSESEEEVKAPAKVENEPAKATENEVSGSEDSESSDEEVAMEDVPAKKQPATLSANGAKGNAKKEQLNNNAQSDSDSEDDEDDEDDDDDDSDENSEDELPTEQKNKPEVESKKSNDSEDDSGEESGEESGGESEDEPAKKPKKKDEVVKMDDVQAKATEKQTAKKSEKKGVQTPAGNQNEKSRSKTLFVGNLSYDVTEEQVMEFFKDAGEAIEVRMGQDSSGRFRGFGHVEFASHRAAQRAIELNGQELLGRPLKLDFAHEKGSFTPNASNDDNSSQKSGKGQNPSIFIRGFDKEQDVDEIENSLKNYFASCGEITRFSLPKDYETGGSKGIAYIDFKDQNALSKALKLNGTELEDCALTVEEAKPRADSRDGGGRSGGRGGGRGGFGGRRGGGRGGFSGGRGGGGGGRGRRF